jgi:hypothetical protein
MSASGARPYYARIISLRCDPADLDALLHIYRTTSVPLVADIPGLITISGIANRATGSASSITVWETPEAREQGGISDESASNLSLYAPLMIGSYVRDAYDVTSFELRGVSSRMSGHLLARVATEDIQHDHWDAATSSLRDTAREMAGIPGDEDSYGVMVFESQVLSRALLIEFAASQRSFDARLGLLRARRRNARDLRQLRRPPSTEQFDVVDLA